MTLQNFYYAAAGICVLIATTINIVLFLRTRPDRLKTAIREAMTPLTKRMDDLEKTAEAHGEQLAEQGLSLERLNTSLQHAPNREDINKLHHRVTQLVASVAGFGAIQKTQSDTLARLNQFLLEHGRD